MNPRRTEQSPPEDDCEAIEGEVTSTQRDLETDWVREALGEVADAG